MLHQAEEPLAVRYVLFCGGACFWEADGFAIIEPQFRQLSFTFLAPPVPGSFCAAHARRLKPQNAQTMSLFFLFCWFGLRPEMHRDRAHARGLLYNMHTREDSCTICTLTLPWKQPSRRVVRKDHARMLKAAPLAAAPRKDAGASDCAMQRP